MEFKNEIVQVTNNRKKGKKLQARHENKKNIQLYYNMEAGN